MKTTLEDKQKEICSKFNAAFYECDLNLKVGISLNVKDGIRPINGLRINLERTLTLGIYGLVNGLMILISLFLYMESI